MKMPPGNGRRFLVRSRASAQSKLFCAVTLSHGDFVALYAPIISMPNAPKGIFIPLNCFVSILKSIE
jgi:hypothetical protein